MIDSDRSDAGVDRLDADVEAMEWRGGEEQQREKGIEDHDGQLQ